MQPGSKDTTEKNDKAFHPRDRSEINWETSHSAQSLERLKANPRVKYIVIAAPSDACPVCQELAGTYPKDQVPRLPVESCSHPLGCRASYMPYLDDIFP